MFSAKRFLQSEVGTAPQVLVLCTLYGIKSPTLEAVQKWYSRDAMPGAWLAKLLGLLELEKGRPVSLAPYFDGVL